jgi:uncharacterized protein (DUF1778 family)
VCSGALGDLSTRVVPSPVAMNLRLTDEQDRALRALAEAEGVSKQEAAVRAILDRAARVSRDREVRRYAREAIAEYASLLDRLADS